MIDPYRMKIHNYSGDGYGSSNGLIHGDGIGDRLFGYEGSGWGDSLYADDGDGKSGKIDDNQVY